MFNYIFNGEERCFCEECFTHLINVVRFFGPVNMKCHKMCVLKGFSLNKHFLVHSWREKVLI